MAIAERCPQLAVLNVGDCRNLTDASIAAVTEKCPILTVLVVHDCDLTALLSNIGNLSKLRRLYAGFNHFRELPRSIIELNEWCELYVYPTPLQTPPLESAMQGRGLNLLSHVGGGGRGGVKVGVVVVRNVEREVRRLSLGLSSVGVGTSFKDVLAPM